MRWGAKTGWGSFGRAAVAGVAALVLAGTPALAAIGDGGSLLPSGFFSSIPTAPDKTSSIEADTLSYDSKTDVVTASGKVILVANGYTAMGDTLIYNRRTGDLKFSGSVVMRDPEGTTYTGKNLVVTGAMKQGFINALSITTANGALITATDASYAQHLQTILNQGTYAPCGQCIDAKGRKIGWRVRTQRIIYDNQSKIVTLEQPVLELLGVPVAWMPWLSLPDPTQKRQSGFAFPIVDYSPGMGVKLGVPYFWTPSENTEVLFTPTLLSRQGFMMGAEWKQYFDNGHTGIKASGLYQLDPGAYAGTVGERRWRGAIQTAGEFVPTSEWTVGWSYTAFSDAAYLTDYHLQDDKSLVNEAYATYLTRDTFADLRVQRFNLLGDVTEADQDKQAMALPNARAEKIIELAPGSGRIEMSAKFLGVLRGDDHVQYSAVTPPSYVTGYAEGKVHGTFQAAWQNQMIAPGGLVFTPYLGLRGDAAYYDGKSALLAGPTSLMSATPIAAMDVRFPMISRDDGLTQIIEPIGQLAYRGSDTSLTGITNDDAQSFVFDDTNLFSYNRFSGADRQETGLRANVGAHYQADFANGSWLDLIAGQSFHLAGTNAYTVTDGAQTGLGSGLETSPSYVVLGARGSFMPGFNLGAKMQVDPDAPRITRTAASASYTINGYDFGANYFFQGADAARGVTTDQQEVGGTVGVPIADYWKLSAEAAWDISTNNWLEAGAGFNYDDGYLLFGAKFTATGPTNTDANDRRFLATFKLKTPDGGTFGF